MFKKKEIENLKLKVVKIDHRSGRYEEYSTKVIIKVDGCFSGKVKVDYTWAMRFWEAFNSFAFSEYNDKNPIYQLENAEKIISLVDSEDYKLKKYCFEKLKEHNKTLEYNKKYDEKRKTLSWFLRGCK